MNNQNRYRKQEKYKKSEMISVRCTPEMKQKLQTKALQRNESVNDLVTGYVESGLKRRTRRDKDKARALVETQETLNHMIANLGGDQQDVKDKLIEFSKGAMSLWDY